MQEPRPAGSLRRVRPDEELLAELGQLEPVNPSTGPEDLARRAAEDRIVYVLDLDHRPATALWVALTAGVPDRLADVLDPGVPVLDPAAADTAVFHSVWNVPGGPTVRDGARRTIELAIDDVRREHPGVTTATTLSPVPGLRAWLADRGVADAPDAAELAELAATYLRSLDGDSPVDPVARFHLRNGARLWRILCDADTSTTGLERSFGVMVNYRYVPEDRDANRASLRAGVVPDWTGTT